MARYLFPAELPSVRTTTDTEGPGETPYTCYEDGTPMHKGEFHTYQDANNVPIPHAPFATRHSLARACPPGFVPNKGAHYVTFPITTYRHSDAPGVTQQAAYVKVILRIMPIVLGILEDSDKVYSRPLYADPIWHFSERPRYTAEELAALDYSSPKRERVDGCIVTLRDQSLEGEVHRFCMLGEEAIQLNVHMQELEKVWGTVEAAQLACVRRLEMADTLARIEDVEEHTQARALGLDKSFSEVVHRGLRT